MWIWALLLGSSSAASWAGLETNMPFSRMAPEEIRSWHGRARVHFFSLMMGGGRPERIPLDPHIISEERLDGLLIREQWMKERAPGGFPVEIAKRVMDPIQQTYRSLGAEDLCYLDVHEEGHVFVGDVPFQRMDRSLSTPSVSREQSGTSDTVVVRELPGAIEILCRDMPVLRYHHALVPPPPKSGSLFQRSAFIHPLWSPQGTVLTRIHAPDHVHHMGIWSPWTHTEFEGRQVDFWNLGKGQGTVRFVAFENKTSGPVFGGFRALHHFVDLKAPGGEKVALHEIWDVKVWDVGEYCPGKFLWDLEITLRCATDSPVLLKAYRYGGFGFRATEAWDGTGDYLTSEGRTGKDGHGTRARWCMVHGPADSGRAGVLFMSHPENRDHPEPMRIWQGDPKIFFNFCPVQQKDWQLVPGEDYKLKYRMLVYQGELDVDEAELFWKQFADPAGKKVFPGHGFREVETEGTYSVKAIQRQTVVGRGDRLECCDTHLSNRSKTVSLSLLHQGLRLDRVH